MSSARRPRWRRQSCPKLASLIVFLLSVATEVDTLIDPLLRELDRRADAVRVGHAALDLPCLANEAPTELSKDNNDRLLPFSKMAVSQQGGGKRRNSGEPAQHSSVNYRRAAHPKVDPRCRSGGPKSAMELPSLNTSESTGMRRERASPPPRGSSR